MTISIYKKHVTFNLSLLLYLKTFFFFFYKQGMKLTVQTEPSLFQTLNESFQHSFFFCAIFKTLPVLLNVSASKKVSIFNKLLKLGLHQKIFPQDIVLQEKILSVKVTHLKRGCLCKRNCTLE